jgi:hypothetical protein
MSPTAEVLARKARLVKSREKSGKPLNLNALLF